ncbi:uncharacterized protein [Prorops nasuta]|uniref:uncharacterized protein n=1 Tax=Prorops nasuta TaxID=863751 RepID=UPI0034CDD741
MSFRALSFSYRISHCTIRQIVYEVCSAIWNCFHDKHMELPTEDNWKIIASNYYKKWNFPNCIGSIDGQHIRIKCPQHSGSFYYNYKQHFSIVLQGIADANCKFIAIDVGAYGKQSDGGIFSQSNIYKRLESTTLNIPNYQCIPSTDILTPFVMVGDDAYPLKSYLLKPYSKLNLSRDERIFNYRLSRARRCIECTFGILTATWRCLKSELQMEPKNIDIVIKCICLLHNIIIDKEGSPNSNNIYNVLEIRMPGTRSCNNYGQNASEVREIYNKYFTSSVGEVQMQYHVI